MKKHFLILPRLTVMLLTIAFIRLKLLLCTNSTLYMVKREEIWVVELF